MRIQQKQIEENRLEAERQRKSVEWLTKMLLEAAKDESDEETKVLFLNALPGVEKVIMKCIHNMHASVYKLTTLIGARSGSPQLQKGVALL